MDTKLRIPDFDLFVNKYDIVGLVETKFDDFDSVDIDGYSFFGFHRKKCKRKSGGVGLLVKNKLAEYIKVLNVDNENCLWFTFNGNCWQNTIFCVVYIPPEGSVYSNIDIYSSIENDILNLNVNDSHICMIGDFNARCGTLSDFIHVDENIAIDNFDFETNFILNKQHLENLGVPIIRSSCDNSCNNYGYKLIDVCKSFDIHIANGRCGNDQHIGDFTTVQNSLVDYVIMSSELLSQVTNFDICDFDPLLSDIHKAISFSVRNPDASDFSHRIHRSYKHLSDSDQIDLHEKPLWNNDGKDMFLRSIDNSKLDSIVDQLNGLSSNSDVDMSDSINKITSTVSEVLVDAARRADMIKTTKVSKINVTNIKRKQQKPWFDNECRMKRSAYIEAKQNFRRSNSNVNFSELKNKSKIYKKEINMKFHKFKKDLNAKFRNLRTTNPKAYWSLLNKYSNEKSSIMSDITSEVFFDHFSKLNENDDSDEIQFDVNMVSDFNTELNAPILDKEILHAIRNLHNNKASSQFDNILNEYIKNSQNVLLPVLRKLFNVIFDSGCIPDVWCKGIIVPIYKKKGDVKNPDNYRGITILSCLGKLFTSILNERLNKFLEDSGILNEEQAGFRKNYSTVDHIFSMKLLIDFYLHKGKKLYCAFVDYRKAFDSIDRVYLWKKLIHSDINGKMLKVIFNIYDKAKSCVQSKEGLSNFFVSSTGVRQGENLSPILFSIYLNDLVAHMSKFCNGLETLSHSVKMHLSDDTVEVYLKLFLLLYADDTVIFAENRNDLQAALDAMKSYCEMWKLKVNSDKTKIVIFSRSKNRSREEFYFNNNKLDILEDFTYLGIKFNFNGKFDKAKKHLCDQARKAMFSVLKKARSLCLDIDLQIHLFDTMIAPILLYGSEVWGIEQSLIINKFQLDFFKRILCVKKCTTTVMIHGELGSLPLDKMIKFRVLNFWSKLINSKHDKISHIMYKLMLELHNHNVYHSPWLVFVKESLEQLGFSNYWYSQYVGSNSVFSKSIKQRIKDQYIQYWNEQIFSLSKCSTYRIFKSNFEMENYFKLLPKRLALALCHFRCSNHKLPVEKGRFFNIDRNQRICQLCNSNLLGDEFHYVFECSKFHTERKRYLPRQYLRPNTFNFETYISDRQ